MKTLNSVKQDYFLTITVNLLKITEKIEESCESVF